MEIFSGKKELEAIVTPLLVRAATAVARSLALLLHKIWIDGSTFRYGAGVRRGRVAAAR